jgi:hypothetical protein
MAVFRDHTGKLIAITRGSAKGSGNEGVYDARGAFIGSVNASATRSPEGTLISTGYNPGALVKSAKA